MTEVINITCFNPKHSIFKVSQSEREEVNYWYCSNKENCEAYQNGKCIMFYQLFSNGSCPYGKRKREVGYTKRSIKCGNLELEAKKKYPDKFYVLKEQIGFAKIGDYIYMPISHIFNVKNPFMSKDGNFWYANNEKLISIEYYTPQIIKQLCLYKPYPWFGYSEIKQYQEKVLPEFLQKLKRYDGDMYNKLLEIYPEAESKADSFSYIGKHALLSSLSKGKVKVGIHPCEWDGHKIKFLDNPVLFSFKGTYYSIPDPEASVTICEYETVNENTILID